MPLSGEISHPVRTFRWNESRIFMLNDIEMIGEPVRISSSESSGLTGTVVVPPLKIRDFTFTSLGRNLPMHMDLKPIGTGAGLALVLLGLTAFAATPAEAQLTFEQASTAMNAAEAEARANGWNLTILITDAEGVPVYLRRMDGASARTQQIASMKCHTVITTGGPSGDYGRALAAGTTDTIPGGIGFDGGLPIMMGGELIGAMSASGARGAEDAQVVRVGLAAIGAEPNG